MLTVYGATGYTGKLIAELLVRRGVADVILAGRSLEKLEALSASLERIAPRGAKLPELAAVSLEDAAGLEALAKRSKVLLSCAGPFARMGPPVVEACLRAGTHYLDITGEVRFMIDTAKRDAEARAKKIVLANAVGVDVVPSDLVCYLAAEALGGGVESCEVAMVTRDAKASGGTLRSILGIFSAPSIRMEDGRYFDEPVAAVERRFVFPPEFGERTAISAALGDLATIPRTTGAKNARTFIQLPGAMKAATKIMSPIAQRLMRGPVASLAEKVVPPSGEGPSEGERLSTRFGFAAEAVKQGRRARASISGADGYGLTAETTVFVALAVLEAGYDRSGALSPMQVVDPARWRGLLERAGCMIEVSSA